MEKILTSNNIKEAIYQRVPILRKLNASRDYVQGFYVDYKMAYVDSQNQVHNIDYRVKIPQNGVSVPVLDEPEELLFIRAVELLANKYKLLLSLKREKDSLLEIIEDDSKSSYIQDTVKIEEFFIQLERLVKEVFRKIPENLVISMNTNTYDRIMKEFYADHDINNLFINEYLDDDDILIYNISNLVLRVVSPEYVSKVTPEAELEVSRFEKLDVVNREAIIKLVLV